MCIYICINIYILILILYIFSSQTVSLPKGLRPFWFLRLLLGSNRFSSRLAPGLLCFNGKTNRIIHGILMGLIGI